MSCSTSASTSRASLPEKTVSFVPPDGELRAHEVSAHWLTAHSLLGLASQSSIHLPHYALLVLEPIQ